MIRAALTGGIATGKSYCLGRFASLGVPVIDADQLARDVVAPGTPGLRAVAERFGTHLIKPDGTLDRAALGGLVFSDRGARAALEAIIHPEVRQRIREWFAQLPHDTRLAIADIPLLFETGQEHDFDRVIVSVCDPLEQVRRVMARDGLSEDEARQRLAAQWPIEEKAARAHYVIRTDGTHADTNAQIALVHDALTRMS
jgi:dephospho-CoA kinase